MNGGIVEIWRKYRNDFTPVKFTIGEIPALMINGALQPLQDAEGEPLNLIVSKITLREMGSIGASRLGESVFVVEFENSAVQRMIPGREVDDVAYATKEE